MITAECPPLPLDLLSLLRQDRIPVLFRQGDGNRLIVKLPYATDNYYWLRDGNRQKPRYHPEEKYYDVPNAWFNDLVERSLQRFGKLYIIQPYRRHEKCAPACWNAHGHECQCSCMGANHGSHHSEGWFVVSETFAVKWEGTEFACRLLEEKSRSVEVRKKVAF